MRGSTLIAFGTGVIAGCLLWRTFGPVPGQAQVEAPSTQLAGGAPAMPTGARPPSATPEAGATEFQPTPLVAGENATGPVSPIPTPPEFDRIPASEQYWHHDSWRQLHQRLEREPLDPEWSRVAESSIASAIGEQQEIGRHGSPVINCRAKTCEVQMLAFGAPDMDEGKWSTLFGGVIKTLRNDFHLEDFSVAAEPDGSAMVLVLSRRETK